MRRVLWLWRQTRWTSNNLWRYDRCHRRTYRGCCRSTFVIPAGQLTILTELIRDRGGVAGGRGRRLGRFVVVIVVLLVFARVVGGSGLSFVIGRVVVVVLLVVGLLGMFGLGFTGVGFLTGSFPVTGVDGMCKFLHALEGLRFSLLSYDVLNSFSQSCSSGDGVRCHPNAFGLLDS